jgi:hypothetical protein
MASRSVSMVWQMPLCVDDFMLTLILAKGLASISSSTVGKAMQVSESNPMVGLDGRAGLLHSLSSALSSNPEFFGPDGRPGGLVGMFPRPFLVITY